MKKNRFYNNKKRNQKWTETDIGRTIDFADKYVAGENYSDKFDYLRPKKKKKNVNKITPYKLFRIARVVGIVILAILIIYIGYTIMAIYMQRHTPPTFTNSETTTETITGEAYSYDDIIGFENL